MRDLLMRFVHRNFMMEEIHKDRSKPHERITYST
jgi:hypothetical protein